MRTGILMFCINRNIVECKVLTATIRPKAVSGINRNIVECKVLNCNQIFPGLFSY